MKSISERHLSIGIYESRNAMGAAAAHRFQTRVEEALRANPRCRVVFGCAPSQDQFFSSLMRAAQAKLDLWKRVEVFHMDEYVGLPDAYPPNPSARGTLPRPGKSASLLPPNPIR